MLVDTHKITYVPLKVYSLALSINWQLGLYKDVKIAEATINKGVGVPLTQGQYDALVSLVFNWGGINFLKSQGLKQLNSGA